MSSPAGGGPNGMDTDLQKLGRRLVGRWTSEGSHPALPGAVIRGSSTFEWLDGEKFLVLRTSYDHPDMPDALSLIGDTDGLQMHYFDSRGVHRLYAVTVTDEGWQIEMGRASAGAYATSDGPFAQRMTYTFGDGDRTMASKAQLSFDDETWQDDLELTHRRADDG
jgi:hypothetical protein